MYATTSVPTLDAKWWPLLSYATRSTPVLGGIVLLQYGDVWHVATITKWTEYGFQVIEGNYRECEQTTREIVWNDKAIRGFFWFG